MGIAYLFIGGLDLLHTLAYSGMGVFQDYDANLPTQLWIAARYLESLSLLIAPAFLRYKLRPGLALAGYAAVSSLLLGAIFGGIFPVSYIEGVGLTPFKIASEYAISLMLLASIGLLLRNRSAFDDDVLKLLVGSSVAAIGSELAFTFYVSVYDFSNLVGHYLKIISFYLMYKAIIETGFGKPYTLLFRELKQAEGALIVRNRELKAYDHTIAHDLKTPLANIVGFANLLAEDLPGTMPEAREALDYIQAYALKAVDMTEHLLRLAELRDTSEVTGYVEMSQIVTAALARFEGRLAERGIAVEVRPDLPPAMGYGPWLEEVFANLIGNAIDYMGEDNAAPRIVIRGARQHNQARYEVQDNGVGIADEDQSHVFDEFTRFHKTEADGTGLGLSIVRRIVSNLDGKVGVVSAPARGSTFWFTLPIGHDARPGATPDL
jgi:signal transduction histidine kinase